MRAPGKVCSCRGFFGCRDSLLLFFTVPLFSDRKFLMRGASSKCLALTSDMSGCRRKNSAKTLVGFPSCSQKPQDKWAAPIELAMGILHMFGASLPLCGGRMRNNCPFCCLNAGTLSFTSTSIQVWDQDGVVIIPDHYIFTADPRANRNIDILRDFVNQQASHILNCWHSPRRPSREIIISQQDFSCVEKKAPGI